MTKSRLRFRLSVGGSVLVGLVCVGAVAALTVSQSGTTGSKDPIVVIPAGQTAATASQAPGTDTTRLTGKALYASALDVWRAARPKDSCMSCHGPDFIDLARIGSTDTDIVRRSIADGASEQEAQTLLRAVKEMRATWRIPTTNARAFRLLQPGGAVLPGNTSAERDLALAGELTKVMPTLMSQAPIRSRAQAEKARDEVLAFQWNKIRVGIAFPLWSADIAHGPAEGTLNDWVADLPRVPKASRRADWIKLQDEYLADPSHLNFWRLYFAVDEMTEPFVTGTAPFDPADEPKFRHFTTVKFKSALIGQHVMRSELRGRLGSFLRGQPAFLYLLNESPFNTAFAAGMGAAGGGTKRLKFLPNPLWEVGDAARIGFPPSAKSAGLPGNAGNPPRMRDTLQLLGAPDFVLESVNPALARGEEETDVRLSWFMAGMLIDQGLGRTSPSNSTKSAEYLLASLWQRDYFLHRSLISTVRTVTRRYAPGAWFESVPAFGVNLGYFDAYNRNRPSRWGVRENQSLPAEVRNAQLDAYKVFTANMYRMNLYLFELDLDSGRVSGSEGRSTAEDYRRMLDFFAYAQLPGQSEDQALVRRIAAKAGVII